MLDKQSIPAKMDFVSHPYLCMSHGCIALATHAPKVMMPVARDVHSPVPMVIGVQLCAYHCSKVKAYDVLDGEKQKEYVSRICQRKNLLRPDWERAYVVAIPIDSDEYRAFQEMRS